MNHLPEVVVTGIGVVTPIGIGIEDFWQALVAGKSGVRVRRGFEDTDLPLRIAASVEDFDARKFIKPRKALKVMCEPIQFGCAAAAMAATDAGLDDLETDPDRLAIVVGTETFFADPIETADVFRKCIIDQNYEHSRWGEFAMREIQPLWMLKYLPNMVASHISIAMDARGPSNSICQAEASSALAIIEGADIIRRGAADIVVAGGTGSRMCLTSMLYRGASNLSHRILEPEKASRPFDANRDGLVAGEGAGALILESKQHALSRGVRPYAELIGFSRTHCAREDKRFVAALAQNLNTVVEQCQIRGELSHINAHADAIVDFDRAEAAAIAEVLGDLPVATNKGNFGNLGPGTSAVEIAATLLALRHKQLPANINYETPDPDCPVNVITQPLELSLPAAIKTSISSTGQIATLVFRS